MKTRAIFLIFLSVVLTLRPAWAGKANVFELLDRTVEGKETQVVSKILFWHNSADLIHYVEEYLNFSSHDGPGVTAAVFLHAKLQISRHGSDRMLQLLEDPHLASVTSELVRLYILGFGLTRGHVVSDTFFSSVSEDQRGLIVRALLDSTYSDRNFDFRFTPRVTYRMLKALAFRHQSEMIRHLESYLKVRHPENAPAEAVAAKVFVTLHLEKNKGSHLLMQLLTSPNDAVRNATLTRIRKEILFTKFSLLPLLMDFERFSFPEREFVVHRLVDTTGNDFLHAPSTTAILIANIASDKEIPRMLEGYVPPHNSLAARRAMTLVLNYARSWIPLPACPLVLPAAVLRKIFPLRDVKYEIAENQAATEPEETDLD